MSPELVARVTQLRRQMDVESLVIICTERGVVVEVDADVNDIPEGEVMFSNVRPGT